jgi:hypothetical protein
MAGLVPPALPHEFFAQPASFRQLSGFIPKQPRADSRPLRSNAGAGAVSTESQILLV